MYTSALSAGVFNRTSQNSLTKSGNLLEIEDLSNPGSSFISLNLDNGGVHLIVDDRKRKISSHSCGYEQRKPCKKGHSHV